MELDSEDSNNEMKLDSEDSNNEMKDVVIFFSSSNSEYSENINSELYNVSPKNYLITPQYQMLFKFIKF